MLCILYNIIIIIVINFIIFNFESVMFLPLFNFIRVIIIRIVSEALPLISNEAIFNDMKNLNLSSNHHHQF